MENQTSLTSIYIYPTSNSILRANIRLDCVEASCLEFQQSVFPIFRYHTEIVYCSTENLFRFALYNECVSARGKFNRWVVTDTTQDQRGGVFIIVVIRGGGAEETREKKVANEKAADYHG